MSADQKAVIIFDGDRISTTYSTAYSGDGGEFAWILPTPVPPSIEDVFEAGVAGDRAFEGLEEHTAPVFQYSRSDGCFPPGTPVATPEGLRPIEELVSGDELISYDTAAGDWMTDRVVRVGRYDYQGDFVSIRVGDSELEATGNHPFLVIRGENLASRPPPSELPGSQAIAGGSSRWVEARHLRKGDILRCRNGGDRPVADLEVRSSRMAVYHLEVAACETYLVDSAGIVVHNGAKEDSDEGGPSDVSLPVTVFGRVRMDHYEAAILGAGDAGELLDWLEENGYRINRAAEKVLDEYIADHWTFVAFKVYPQKIRQYDEEYLPPVTVGYQYDRIIFPLRISAISSSESVRISLFVAAPSFVDLVGHALPDLMTDSPDSLIVPDQFFEERLELTRQRHRTDFVRVWGGHIVDDSFLIPDLEALFRNSDLPYSHSKYSHMWLPVTRIQGRVSKKDMDSDLELKMNTSIESFYPRIRAPEGWGTPLAAAVDQHDYAAVRTLIEADSDVNARDARSRTVLGIAAETGAPADILNLLLSAGADPDIGLDDEYEGRLLTVAALAAMYGHTDVLEVLVNHGVNIDAPCSDGTTPLFWAASYLEVEAVRWLIDHGADVNHRSEYGSTPLHWSLSRRYSNKSQLAVMELLLQAGADADITARYSPSVRAEVENPRYGTDFDSDYLELINRYDPTE